MRLKIVTLLYIISSNFCFPDLFSDIGSPDDNLTIFGARPIYTNGGKTNVIVDDFSWIDDTRPAEELNQIAAAIEEWKAAGIQYAAYYGLGGVESAAGAASMGDAGKVRNLDGNYGGYNFTRSAFRDYLINAGKTAVDLGATYFLLDGAAPGLKALSFDDEILAEFRYYLQANFNDLELEAIGVTDVATFNYRDYLVSSEGGNYTNNDSIINNNPSGTLWEAWLSNIRDLERAFFEEWTSSIRNYAKNEYSTTVYFGGNRYEGARQWDNIDKFDFGIAETFLDSRGYPYHNLEHIYKNIRNFNKRFWSWNFPANTGIFNGSNDPWGKYKITELSKVFMAEAIAAGGLYQSPIDWVSYYHVDNRLTSLAPYYRFVRSHPGLFNLMEAGEFAVVYNEAYEISNPEDFTKGYRGIMMLLGDVHRPFDVLFAGHPDKRGGSDPFASADLTAYKAIVLPNTRRMTNSQVGILDDYLSNGGTIIGLGKIADLDEDGNNVSSSRTFDDHFGSNATTIVNSGKAIAFDSNLGNLYHENAATSNSETNWEVTAGNLSSLSSYQSTWASAVDGVVARSFTTTLSRLVNIHRYRSSSDGSEIYHLVNRDINLSEDVNNQSINVTSEAVTSVSIPSGFNSSSVKLSWMTIESPNPIELPFSVNNGMLEFEIPSFVVWGVLKVGTIADTPLSIDEEPESNFDMITLGNRPDRVDENGDISLNYMYWRGGNHGGIPWSFPYFATDDNEVDSVRLYYRFSNDKSTWGEWLLHSTTDVSGSNVSGQLSFDAPDGEGHYQLRIQAVDDIGQYEVVISSRDETGYGVDWTPPQPPKNVSEATYSSGTWIEGPLQSLAFTWDPPIDNLSGYWNANVYISNGHINIADGSLTNIDYEWSPTLSDLNIGESYKLLYRQEDAAGNWGDTVELFSFRYGTLPVADLKDIEVVEKDSMLTLSWKRPISNEYSHASFYFRPASDLYGNWISAGLSPDSNTINHDIENLINGTEYQVKVVSVAKDGRFGNELVLENVYTPLDTPSPPSAPTNVVVTPDTNIGSINISWTD
ncbi:MAG: hypothetical protein CMI18_00160, partial [Opitutaceae bacterium]|nr:hypothetical protein [Opitutaceae bacterium]